MRGRGFLSLLVVFLVLLVVPEFCVKSSIGQIPVLNVSSPKVNEFYNSTSVLFNFSFTSPYRNAASAVLYYKLDLPDDEKGWSRITFSFDANNASYFLNLVDLSEGNHSLLYVIETAVGSEKRTIPFTVDTVPPKIKVLLPEKTEYYTNQVPLNFTVDEPVLWKAYCLDGQEMSAVNSNATITRLTDGDHSIRVFAMDMAGNIGVSETVNFKVPYKSGIPQTDAQALPSATTWILLVVFLVAISLVLVGAGLLFYLTRKARTSDFEK